MIRRMDRDAREIFDAAVRAVQPAVLMDHVATRVWAGIEAADRVVVMAVGKAAASMTAAFLPRLGRSPAAIFVTMPDTPDLDLPGAEVARASHPVPDERSVRAARRALEIFRNGRPRTPSPARTPSSSRARSAASSMWPRPTSATRCHFARSPGRSVIVAEAR